MLQPEETLGTLCQVKGARRRRTDPVWFPLCELPESLRDRNGRGVPGLRKGWGDSVQWGQGFGKIKILGMDGGDGGTIL